MSRIISKANIAKEWTQCLNDFDLQNIEKMITANIGKKIVEALNDGNPYVVQLYEMGQKDSIDPSMVEFFRSLSIRKIVRCKDCQYWGREACVRVSADPWEHDSVEADDFCSKGVEKASK